MRNREGVNGTLAKFVDVRVKEYRSAGSIDAVVRDIINYNQ